MKKFIIITAAAFNAIFFFASSPSAKAQYDAMFTQYMFNEMFINPAYAGYKDAFAVTALHRQQWVGFAGRPITTTLTMHSPIYKNTLGLGLSVLNENIGHLNRNLIYLSFAYRAKTSENAYLSFGLNGGIHLQSEGLANLDITDPNDPHFRTNTKNVLTPNFGFGILYHTPKFYAGLAIPRLIDDNIDVNIHGNVIKNINVRPKKWHYYLTVGKTFEISEAFSLKPQLMVKANINAPLQFDVNLNSLIKQRLWLGVSYRSMADIAAIVGIHIVPQFLISYSYDYSLNKLRNHSSGSHEIALSYLFYYKDRKVANPRFF